MLLVAWLHRRPDPPWNLLSSWFYQGSCPGIRLSGLRRELTPLAIWRCVFRTGLDKNTRSSLYLRKMTQMLWVPVLLIALQGWVPLGRALPLSGLHFCCLQNKRTGTSLVVQWLSIHLPTQGTRVRALVWEDPTCRGATKPLCHNY